MRLFGLIMKLKINFLIDEQSQKMSAREASYNPQQWHSMGATQNWTFLIQVELTIIRFPRNSAISNSHAVYLNFVILPWVWYTRSNVLQKKITGTNPLHCMCTKKLSFSYISTFALAKRQIKTLRCSFHFALYLYYYLCQSKRKFRIRLGTFKALLFHVSMTNLGHSLNQTSCNLWYPVLQPHFNVVTQEEMFLCQWIVP